MINELETLREGVMERVAQANADFERMMAELPPSERQKMEDRFRQQEEEDLRKERERKEEDRRAALQRREELLRRFGWTDSKIEAPAETSIPSRMSTDPDESPSRRQSASDLRRDGPASARGKTGLRRRGSGGTCPGRADGRG